MYTGPAPKFTTKTPLPAFKLDGLKLAIGKKISAVEFGEEEMHENAHRSEAIVLHFTDGTALAIMTGSNASEISSNRLSKPSEIHVDLAPRWISTEQPEE